ncbi:BTAD domain-containing putative transcriptional regulator [Acrocarpospora macrocephala]|uniref:BTAD domain-containing putative transcriptional regulator n=1 Tax=Acrocarpospora macrocephala TaxID=150177 RepID=UPI001C3FDC5D|nr:BTAD domain-containing putative transcriptional regulator [Acrocarpospora macrocephala]
MIEFGVLGSLQALDGQRKPVDLKGPRHREVLARLLIAKGRVVPVDWLIGDLWDDPPEGALGAVQTFVSALRRALEPGRPRRAPAKLLVTAAPGYALRAERENVDAWRFEQAVAGSRELPAEQALTLLDGALALWRGPAYAEFAGRDWARGEITRLGELRLLAVERRAEAALALGLAADVVADLEAQVTAHPHREDAWRLLALALYRSGRQGDALGVLRRARTSLVEELGVDPGSELRRLEADILAQAPHLALPARERHPPRRPFFGRTEELTALQQSATALGLISGDAGAGKTALAGELARRLLAEGWTSAWGASPEDGGVPAAWPWSRILAALGAFAEFPGDRFALRRHIVAAVARAAERAPLLLILDDLQWAGEETLDVLVSLAVEPPPGRILIIGTYRSTEVGPSLTAALARIARVEPTRVRLGGLPEEAVAELVAVVSRREPEPAPVKIIYDRSGGNPFYVRELARLYDAEGVAGLSVVPEGIRDVVRHRLAGLPDRSREVLRQAAVIGQEVELAVLTELTGDEETVLRAVEDATRAGFVVEPEAERVDFAHALVRDTLYDDMTRSRRARYHARTAEIVERLRPYDIETIAHHYVRARSRDTAARAAHYARAAAERAERRFAPHLAARLWRDALSAHDLREDPPVRARLELVMGLVRALALTGDLDAARTSRGQVLTAMGELDDPDLSARVLGAFDVPAVWTTNDDEPLARRVVAAAERALAALPADRVAERSRLQSTIALESRGHGSARAHDAAADAEALARRAGDPVLLAFALNGRYMQSFHRTGLAPERIGIGTELLALAVQHDLPGFEVTGHLILLQAHSALADFDSADRHAAAADAFAEWHEISLVGVFTQWYAALRLAVEGRTAEAEAAYRSAAFRLNATGMGGMARGLLPLALLSLDRGTVDWDADWGTCHDWAHALRLLISGRSEEAATALRTLPASPRDLLYEVRLALEAEVAIGVRDHAAMRRIRQELLPAADELAGGGTGLLSFGPVRRYLDGLTDPSAWA